MKACARGRGRGWLGASAANLRTQSTGVPPNFLQTLVAALAARWRVGLLVLVTMLVWVAHHDRWTRADWQVPTDYAGDAHEVLARIQAAAEGETWPLMPQVISRLGTPFGAHWNAYPTPDKLLMLFCGGLARLVGLFAASNLGLLLAQVSAVLAFYLAVRWLRVRWEWAAAGALLFAYSYHTFHRGLAHFSFVFTWTVPLGLLAVWLVAQSRRLAWRSAGAAVCLGAGLALGVGNPYLLLFWGQLLGWALLVQWLGPRRRVNLAIGLGAGAVAIAAFVVTNAEIWFHIQEPGGLPLLARNYGGTELYALKPVEMFIPPEFHRFDFLSFFGHRYRRWSDWHGETFLPYLGLCGIAGLVGLLAVTARRGLSRRAVPGQALSVGWLLAYASVGGVTNLLAFFFGFQLFRATNRVAVFVSALVLVFLVVRLSRLTMRWAAPWRLLAAAVVTGIGLLDQLPRAVSPERRARIAAEVRADQQLGRELEAAVPAGAMVFQLPVLGFPEVVPPHRLADYEHFRVYLVTRQLRFSYGAAKYRSRSRWQRDLENEPAGVLVRRLEEYGFAALYVNRKGYEDRAERLLRDLAALGYRRTINGALGNQVVVLLNPSPQPQQPLGRMFTVGRGWHPRPEAGVRWAEEEAALSYFNPYAGIMRADLQLELLGPSPRQVEVVYGDRRVAAVAVGTTPVVLRLPAFALQPGVNMFWLRSSEPATRLGPGRNQLRAMGLKNSSVRIVDGAAPGEASRGPPQNGR